MGRTFRVLVANKSKLVRELFFETLAEQPWIEIVGELAVGADSRGHVQKTLPDSFLITAVKPGKRPDICDALFREFPELRIIAVARREN